MSSTIAIDSSQIHERAYARWQERGCPGGSPDHDWFEAEQELVREQAAIAAGSVKPVAVLAAAPSPEPQARPVEKKRVRSPRGRISSPLTLNASVTNAEEPESKVHARAAAIPRPNKRRKVAR
ncbi:MAG: DUF2934 domain-containing protein [Polyangiaceae bacterium]